MDIKQLESESFRSITTEKGLEILENNPRIISIVDKFNDNSTLAENELISDKYLGTGNHSSVWAVDGVAVKVSSHSTGRIAWKHTSNTGPENLIRQLNFLNIFRKYLDSRSDGYISVPEQYFAFRNFDGDYIKAEQEMTGWKPISSFCDAIGITDEEKSNIYNSTKSKIIGYLSCSYLKFGLTDAGLESKAKLHGGNILVPDNTKDIINAPVCIIDQPSKGLKGKIAESLISLMNK